MRADDIGTTTRSENCGYRVPGPSCLCVHIIKMGPFCCLLCHALSLDVGFEVCALRVPLSLGSHNFRRSSGVWCFISAVFKIRL